MGFLTQALKLIPLIVTAVQAVEKIGGRKGKEKQDAAIDLVGDLVPLLEAGIGRELVNEERVQDAMRKVVDAAVSLMNVVKDVQAKRAAA